MALAVLDPDISALSGRQGNVVYSHRPSGTYVRPFVAPSNPRTTPQQTQRLRMTATTLAWAHLTPTEIAAWELWASANPRRNRLTDAPYASSAFNAFASLTLRWLQSHPAGTPPALPPFQAFTPAALSVTAAGVVNAIVWQASGANRAGVVTELRAQLLGRVRSAPPMDKAPLVLTTPFPGPSFAVSTTLAPGLYAVAYRFLDQTTGEVGEMQVLPHVWVPGPDAGGGNDGSGMDAGPPDAVFGVQAASPETVSIKNTGYAGMVPSVNTGYAGMVPGLKTGSINTKPTCVGWDYLNPRRRVLRC